MAATESFGGLLKRLNLNHLHPLLKEEEIDDVELMRSLGAGTLFQSLRELGIEAKAVTALTAALFPDIAWDEPRKRSDSDDEWLMVDADGKIAAAAAAESEDDDLQLEENAAGDDEDGDGPLLEDNPCECSGAAAADDDDDDELQLEDNGDEADDDDDLMLEENHGGEEVTGGGALGCDDDDDDELQLEDNGR